MKGHGSFGERQTSLKSKTAAKRFFFSFWQKAFGLREVSVPLGPEEPARGAHQGPREDESLLGASVELETHCLRLAPGY